MRDIASQFVQTGETFRTGTPEFQDELLSDQAKSSSTSTYK
jgi:hypothetical protein